MASYFGEIIALVLCWLFYCEFRWILERRVRKACSNDFITKRCKTFADKLFFKPVSGKVNFGALYYINIVLFYILLILSVFHILFGWMSGVNSVIKLFTTILIIFLGTVGAVSSIGSTEMICGELNITDKNKIRWLKIVSLGAELIVMLTYLYITWAYIF